MDRFKFRVWENNTRNCYLKDEKTAIVGDGDLIYGDMITNAMQLAYGEDNPNIIVEQCTGLKDKNGNLIYEGDIVKDSSLLGRKYTVEWDCDNVQFEATANIYDTEFSEVYGLYVDSAKKLEIIGNIHEQKDNK